MQRTRGLSLYFVILLYIASNFHGGEGRKLSRMEDWELERQLKVLNKPAMKSVHIGPREIYDCINIYEQPAFDNPLLKNHKLQLKPIILPKGLAVQVPSERKPSNFGLKDETCPIGTVPIRRTSKDDLINAKFVINREVRPRSDVHPTAPGRPQGQHIAAYSTHSNGFYGSRARFNIWNPTVSGGHEYSALKMTFLSWHSSSSVYNDVIKVGWNVFPEIYGDNKTRLSTLWAVDDQTGCCDTLCPGFVLTQQLLPLGIELIPISEPGGQQYDIQLLVFQDRETKNWWLVFGDDPIPIGYWPKELFTSLAENALEVGWGGETYSSPDLPSPPMGSGRYDVENLRGNAAYMANILLVNDKNALYNITSAGLPVIDDSEKCYHITESSDLSNIPGGGFGFYVGGPGGPNC